MNRKRINVIYEEEKKPQNLNRLRLKKKKKPKTHTILGALHTDTLKL